MAKLARKRKGMVVVCKGERRGGGNMQLHVYVYHVTLRLADLCWLFKESKCVFFSKPVFQRRLVMKA